MHGTRADGLLLWFTEGNPLLSLHRLVVYLYLCYTEFELGWNIAKFRVCVWYDL